MALIVAVGAPFISISYFQTKEHSAMAFLSPPKLNMVNPSCLDNYDTWNNSLNFNSNADWKIDFLPPTVAPTNYTGEYNIFTDINGDGLVDFIAKSAQQGANYNLNWECVYLNNGKGWDPAYKCVTKWNAAGNNVRYYGDCAG
jgi:hypothetical protein